MGFLRSPVLLPCLASLLGACGPQDLAENVEHAGPIGGPFAASRFFAASGFMGDGMEAGYLTAQVDEGCKPRPADARGNCYRFEYRPGSEKWAGVYWQHPANNWGSQPGRSIAAEFSHVRFFIAAEHDVLPPEGAGIDAACSDSAPCRPGLACQSGRCEPAASTEQGERCLVSSECSGAAQCVAQRCAAAGEAGAGEACGNGQDELCGPGLRCGVMGNTFSCVPEGAGDLGAVCTSRNECSGGLYCRAGVCSAKTRTGPFNFQVGGIAPTKAGLTYSDQIGVSYFATGEKPQPIVGPDWQQFVIDLSRAGEFSTLIGAFMWAVPFPDIDELSALGPQPYAADMSQPAHIYLDDIVFE